jgi:hypothetical protein
LVSGIKSWSAPLGKLSGYGKCNQNSSFSNVGRGLGTITIFILSVKNRKSS